MDDDDETDDDTDARRIEGYLQPFRAHDPGAWLCVNVMDMNCALIHVSKKTQEHVKDDTFPSDLSVLFHKNNIPFREAWSESCAIIDLDRLFIETKSSGLSRAFISGLAKLYKRGYTRAYIMIET